MIIYPAIDIYEGKAVRLIRGDYSQMTVYSDNTDSDNPVNIAHVFKNSGAVAIHIVDLEGARWGKPSNFDIINRIANETELFIQVGGGIRSEQTIIQYLNSGVKRVILGTAAVSNPEFLQEMMIKYGNAIAVGVDIKDSLVAIKGWTEVSNKEVFLFCKTIEEMGVQTIICTDISKDGILAGTNIDLYKKLKKELKINIIASGGVSSIKDIETLSRHDIHGAIIGKALYTGDINLSEAIKPLGKFYKSLPSGFYIYTPLSERIVSTIFLLRSRAAAYRIVTHVITNTASMLCNTASHGNS